MLPGMAGPLAANPKPTSFDLGPLDKVYVTGVVSAFGQSQNNTFPGDKSSQLDVDHAMIMINKPDGLVQFFMHAGAYSLPDLGVPYLRASDATKAFYGPLPQGFIKLAPTDNFSLLAGSLPTLIGAEYTFSFENMNIERGLLWNQENAVNRGVQVNYTAGPLALAASWNDGFYSKKYSWASVSATYTVDDTNTLAFIAGGNPKHTSVSTTATPLFQNNEQIYNLIYTHIAGPWTFQPYLQYTYVPPLPEFGAPQSASTFGAALLMNYNFDSDSTPAGWRLAGFNLPVRVEYISSTGDAANGASNLLYGPGSKAWSITVTPTYQYKIFFARAEFSYVGARNTTPGLAFGANGTATSQTRGLFEVGLLF
jgi:Putative beta-barrel porin-2, OmpL-like. bbp2